MLSSYGSTALNIKGPHLEERRVVPVRLQEGAHLQMKTTKVVGAAGAGTGADGSHSRELLVLEVVTGKDTRARKL